VGDVLWLDSRVKSERNGHRASSDESGSEFEWPNHTVHMRRLGAVADSMPMCELSAVLCVTVCRLKVDV